MSKLSLRPALAALAGILIAIGGCAESPSAPAAPAQAEELQFLRTPLAPSYARAGSSSSAVIDENGGVLQTAQGHKLIFPAGALSGPTEITMTSVNGYVGVDLEPHGLTFPAGREPTLLLDYSNAGLLGGLSALFVVYVDESGRITEILPTRMGFDGKARANLEHFSRYLTARYIGAGS